MIKKKDPIFVRAIHEAGHGVICHYLGVIPKQLTTENEKDGGFSKFKNPLNDFKFENTTLQIEEKAKSLVMVYIAGREAVLKTEIEKNTHENFEFDYVQANECLSILTSNEEEKKVLIGNLEQEVREILIEKDRWRGVEKLAEELTKNKILTWIETKAILQQMLLRPRFRIS